MGNFGGFVNFDTDFTLKLSEITGKLWEMSTLLGKGVDFGIDICEKNAAFAQNSLTPLHGQDYCFGQDGNKVYIFCSNYANDFPLSGALYLSEANKLYLFRKPGGNALYYGTCRDGWLGSAFSSSLSAISHFCGSFNELKPQETLIFKNNIS
ncbi:MAG: hypothetical protein FWC95_06460 [Defluviitaleaceae bacterium]|nr:hypothetical protein [Defluviitaleaceae bacterium]